VRREGREGGKIKGLHRPQVVGKQKRSVDSDKRGQIKEWENGACKKIQKTFIAKGNSEK